MKFCLGHHAVEEDKAAFEAEYFGESSEDEVTVLLEKYAVLVQSKANKQNSLNNECMNV